jgi:hypothetical protein
MPTLYAAILNRAAPGDPDAWVAVAHDGERPMGAWTFTERPEREPVIETLRSQHGAHYDEIVVEPDPRS